MIPEEDEHKFDFDLLDSTKLVPEELVPVKIVGKMVLNRNPDNYFAETEQVAFCPSHIVPGIDFSNDPLLQGRLHSYLDTQISRLGGANFHEIPINRPLAEMHNNQRDGKFRHEINKGRVAYEPNTLAAISRRKPRPKTADSSRIRKKLTRIKSAPAATVLPIISRKPRCFLTVKPTTNSSTSLTRSVLNSAKSKFPRFVNASFMF